MVSFTQIAYSLALSSLAVATAPIATDSPAEAKYIATFTKTIKGSIEFSSTNNGTVKVDVDVYDLPSSGGPFLYHVHQLPVPSDGNCTGTLDHLNPYNGSATSSNPADLEVGDLSGKHGNIAGQSLNTSYIDEYLSLNKDDPAFVGNLSVVVHYYNTTRIACANITEDSTSPSNQSSTSSPSSSLAAFSSSSGAANADSGSWATTLLAAIGMGLSFLI